MSARTASIASSWSGVSRRGRPARTRAATRRRAGRRGRPPLALGIEVDQLAGERLGGAARTQLHALPLLAAELRQRRIARVGADVAADLVQLVARHEDAVSVEVLELEVIARHAADGLRLEAREAGDAVVLVHNRGSGAQVGERGDRAGLRPVGRSARRRRRRRCSGSTASFSCGAMKPSRRLAWAKVSDASSGAGRPSRKAACMRARLSRARSASLRRAQATKVR